jgi:cupin 2 domain-containing protein
MNKNLFADIPANVPDELFEVLAEGHNVRIERIVSTGQASPADFWYDQDQAEFIVVLKGEAELHFEGEDALIHLMPGDHMTIPSHRRHRVEWTTPDEPTVWLVVFFG